MSAWAKSPWSPGMVRWSAVDCAPALSPNTMTWVGSPPKRAMFRCTHWSAAVWSLMPKFPADPMVSPARNPSTPSR